MMIASILFAFAFLSSFSTQAFVPTTRLLSSSQKKQDSFFAVNGEHFTRFICLYQSKNPHMTVHEDGMPEDDRNELMPCEVKRFGRWNDNVVDLRQQMYYEQQQRDRFNQMNNNGNLHRMHFPDKPASNYMHVHDEQGVDDVDDVDDDDDRTPGVGLPGDMYRGKVLEADVVGFENFTPDYTSSSWESSVPVGAFSSTGIPTAPPMGMFLKEKQFNVFEETLAQQHEELQQQQQEPQEAFFPQAKFPPDFSESVRQDTAPPPTSTLVETSFATSVPCPPPRGMFLNNNGPAIFGEDGPPPGMFGGGGGGSNEPAVASDESSAPSHPRMAEDAAAIPQQEYTSGTSITTPPEEPSFSMTRPGPPPMGMF